MTSFTLGMLIVIAAAQAPSPRPAATEPAAADPVTFRVAALPETEVGTQSFSKLFTLSEDDIRKAQVRAQLESRQHAIKPPSRIVCGMVVIQADPRIDPKMIHRPLATLPTNEPTTTFHIKRIPPGTCNE